MSTEFLNLVRADAAAFVSGEAASECVFTSRSGPTATVQATANKIGRRADPSTGLVENVISASIVVAESVLLTANAAYPIRNGEGKVFMNGDLVNVADNSGVVKNYIVAETIADETVGLITLMLGFYQS